ncbi:hypothetical protein CEXT_720201 [Caerostris extrusa]|uniref:Uncharacterized protein n=1 Tax=Caerostris extrusa TaxID=172846 RepID=A0AAV4T075_CAEEX|nr:hypothetical protein CEXT_720201 [Caerostris extrusa]
MCLFCLSTGLILADLQTLHKSCQPLTLALGNHAAGCLFLVSDALKRSKSCLSPELRLLNNVFWLRVASILWNEKDLVSFLLSCTKRMRFLLNVRMRNYD